MVCALTLMPGAILLAAFATPIPMAPLTPLPLESSIFSLSRRSVRDITSEKEEDSLRSRAMVRIF